MSLEADVIVDRRRLSRRVSRWRIAAFILALVALALALAPLGSGVGLFGLGNHVARISIDGLIDDDRKLQETIDKAARDRRVRALLLDINSPGGTTTGAEALFLAIREAAGKKPVVAALGTVAASGGYIAAIAADRIVARGNTITGSIGVVFQWTQLEEALAKLGIDVDEVKSAPLKAEPSPFNETPPEAIEVMRAMVVDSYVWFVGLVAERRGFDEATARRLGDGRVYTGRQALDVGLVDEIGGEKEAIAWLAAAHGIDADIKVRDWTPADESEALGLLGRAAAGLARLAGLSPDGLVGALGGLDAARRLRLDGLISVWHAPGREAD